MKKISYLIIGVLIGGVLLNGNTINAAAGLLAERSTQPVYVDGKKIEMETYNIAGANYVKLRDIGEAVGFNVYYWSGSVQIDSSAPYTGEAPADEAVSVSVDHNNNNRIVQLPTDGSKYTPQVGDLIPCPDETLYEIKDVSRWENNCFAPGPLPDLPKPTCDWTLFSELELPAPEVRHFSDDKGDDLFVRNVFETRRMQYTLYNAIGRTPESWRDGRPLAKVFLTIPAEYEPYTHVFWPWRASELEKQIAVIPRGRFRVASWDYYKNHVFLETRYYLCTV